MHDFWKKHGMACLSVLCAISCFCCVVSMVRISTLQRHLNELASTQISLSNQMQEQINGISGNIRTAFEQARNPVLTAEAQFGAPDWANRTVPLTGAITLKTYDPADTAVSVILNGTEYFTTLTGSRFVFTADVPLSTELHLSSVRILSDGQVRTQTMENRWNALYELLPCFDVSQPGELSLVNQFSGGTAQFRAEGLITVKGTGNLDIRRADLLVQVDGQDQRRLPVDLTPSGQDRYRQQDAGGLLNNPQVAPAREAPADPHARQSFYYFVDQTIPLPKGSSCLLQLEMEDASGAIYRISLAGCQPLPDSSASFLDLNTWGVYPAVYTQDGTQVFDPADLQFPY